ncbi:hypothetical protein NDU88_000918 [Pleurodeles waltl]|uniref:Uncharacterized protein n=1 Tax=Pleurodeles waltl TaxID=8319 RepID=A0AAV7SXS6_PLEWA|nr:hypothetical protein NDU88_000918 [Pleurodeles waltl]
MNDDTRNNRCLQGVVGVPIQHANDAQAGRSHAIPTQEERRTEKKDKGDNVRNGDTTSVMNTFSRRNCKLNQPRRVSNHTSAPSQTPYPISPTGRGDTQVEQMRLLDRGIREKVP